MKNKIEISTIRKLKRENKPDELIMRELGIPTRTYNRYKEKLRESEQEDVENVLLEDVSYDILEYLKDLHDSIDVCRTIVRSGTSIEKMEAQRLLLMCHSVILDIHRNAPQILANMQVAPTLRKAFSKIQKSGQDLIDIKIVDVDKKDEDGRQEKE